MAKSFGLSERVIGLVIVGPGTSFPELIASIVAARQRNAGNGDRKRVRSNIFFTLGVTSFSLPVPLDPQLNPVVSANCAVTELLVLWVTLLRRHQIGRPLGLVLPAACAAYRVPSLRG